jgi:hypothetical protein
MIRWKDVLWIFLYYDIWFLCEDNHFTYGDNNMNFSQEMNKFFSRYSPGERQEVELSPPYQEAAQKEDAILAQAIACEILEGAGRTKQQAKYDADSKWGKRLFDQFQGD